MIRYSDLNENQKQAVIDEANHIRIIAGAGSGKTRVLTMRIAYLIEKSTFALLLRYVGWFILAFECIVVTVNIFSPILFHFDQDGNYVTDSARHITMFIQLVLYFMTTVYLFAIAFKYKEKFRRRIAISAFGLVMSAFLVLQTFYPMLPLYSAGYIIGTCLLHTFVLEDYKRSQIRKLKEHLENETRQRKELGEARRMAYYDALTSVRNKKAFFMILLFS